MTRYLRDGTRLQAGIIRAGLEGAGQSGIPRAYTSEAAIVVVALPRDHANNRSKSFVECDVFITRIEMYLPNVPVSYPVLGVNSGLEWIPFAGTTPVPTDPLDLAAIRRSDADWVIVDFLGGYLPIIRGQIPRRLADTNASYSPTAAQGRRVTIRHAGSTVTILPTGEVQVTVPNGQLIKLGDADGTEQMLILLNKFRALIDNHIHPSGVGPTGAAQVGAGNPSYPIGTPLASTLDTDWNSTKVRAK